MSLIPVASLDDIHRLDTYRGGILVFKHSTRCSISGAALNRVRNWLDVHPDVSVGYVDVIGQRPLSNELAEFSAVPHQSPQILWLRPGCPAEHESHFGITPAWLDALN
ncbi:MAG: hypothetical protein RIR07_337 [Bacteroidota bacterium]